MKTYFGYIRVSTPRQGLGVSLDEQRAAIAAFAEKRGLAITEWFVETETAAKQGRTEFTKMIKALRTGKADGVVIHKIDRSARNMKDWASLGELIDAGIDVQFAHESLDLHSRGGRLAADIQAVVAADYIRNLRDEVLKGFYGRLKQGIYPLPAPIGYLDRGAGKPKEIDPERGPLVRCAFERYATGTVSLRTLQKEMKARGLRRRSGGALTLTGIATMLHSPFYIGIIRISKRGETFQGVHTPLITKELYDRVQAILSGRHIPKSKRHTFLFRGMIAHAGCTRRLTGELAKGRYVYYRCHGLQCRNACVSERDFSAAILAKLNQIACSAEDMRDLGDLVAEQRAKQAEDSEKDSAALHMRMIRCDERTARLTDALIDGVISKDVFEARKLLLLKEHRDIQDQLDTLNGEPQWLKAYRMFELQNPQVLRYETATDDEKRDLVSALCSNLVLDGKKPAITLRFPYDEIAKTHSDLSGAPSADDVRTKEQIDKASRSRAQRLFEIFRSINTEGTNEERKVA
jgi:site-specific DNA recombinase